MIGDRIGQPAIAGEERTVKPLGERDVQRVVRRHAIAKRESLSHERRERMSIRREARETLQRLTRGAKRDVARSVEASESRQDLGISMRRNHDGAVRP